MRPEVLPSLVPRDLQALVAQLPGRRQAPLRSPPLALACADARAGSAGTHFQPHQAQGIPCDRDFWCAWTCDLLAPVAQLVHLARRQNYGRVQVRIASLFHRHDAQLDRACQAATRKQRRRCIPAQSSRQARVCSAVHSLLRRGLAASVSGSASMLLLVRRLFAAYPSLAWPAPTPDAFSMPAHEQGGLLGLLRQGRSQVTVARLQKLQTGQSHPLCAAAYIHQAQPEL